MKIFDFSDGTKGKQLVANAQLIDWSSGYVHTKDPMTGKDSVLVVKDSKMMGYKTNLSVVTSAGCGEKSYKPEDFGVEAILFCQGNLRVLGENEDKGTWEWMVIGTDAWIAKAIAFGFFK